jgi:hypothetical protein
VVAATDAPNVRSARLLERLGMRREWRRLVNGRDTIGYALSNADRPGHERPSLPTAAARTDGAGVDVADR